MRRSIHNPGRWRLTKRWAVGAAVGVVFAGAPAGRGDAQPVDALTRGELLGFVDEAGDPLAFESEVGFRFNRVDKDTEKLLKEFFEALDAGVWEKAYKGYDALREPTQDRLGPAGTDGRFEPVNHLIRQRIGQLPEQGRSAFRLYFDAMAAELLAKIEQHPYPGSAAQLRQAEELYSWFLLTSSGPRACDLLGDLYFEQGRFLEAADCWATLLAAHPGTRPELVMQSKRCLALWRAGESAAARAIAEGLTERFGDQPIRLAGEQQTVKQYFSALLDPAGAAAQANASAPVATEHRYLPTALPEPGTAPQWCFTILNDANAKRIELASSGRRNYIYNNSLAGLIPPVATDDQRLYGHWMGSVFALDLRTGKVLWRTMPFPSAVESIGYRNRYNSNADDYRIALTQRHVLILDAVVTDRSGSFTLTAYDKQTGKPAWDAAEVLDDRSICGEPLVDGPSVYLTSRPRNATAGELHLHRLNAANGELIWSAPLGELDLRVSPYTALSQTIQPVLATHERLIFVLTNNGGLLAVEPVLGQVQWARKLDAPAHLRVEDPLVIARVPDEGSMPEARPGGLYIVDSTLYAKESLSQQMYAMHPQTGELAWQRRVDSLYAELAGADDDELVLISQDIEVHRTDDGGNERGRTLGANKIGPPASNFIVTDQTLYMLANGQVQAVPMDRPRNATAFTSPHLVPNEGGKLVTAPGLLICVTRKGLAAFPVPTQDAVVSSND